MENKKTGLETQTITQAMSVLRPSLLYFGTMNLSRKLLLLYRQHRSCLKSVKTKQVLKIYFE